MVAKCNEIFGSFCDSDQSVHPRSFISCTETQFIPTIANTVANSSKYEF
jgi:hypothetical protein